MHRQCNFLEKSMIELNVSFTDFWEGHDPKNNILTNIVKDALNVEINIVSPEDADICFVTIYGAEHPRILKQFAKKSISGWGKM